MKKIILSVRQRLFGFWNYFKSSSLKRKAVIVVGLILAWIIISTIVGQLTKKPPYTTTAVEKTDITESVSETGSIIASGTTEVFSPSDGVVTETYISNGETVFDGQELFIVKSSASEQQAQAAYSNYLTALASLNTEQAQANSLRAAMYSAWDEYRDLATNGTYQNGDQSPNTSNREAAEFQIAQDQWLAAEKQYKDQQTAIAQAQAQVSSTYLLYQATQDATVKAPVAGVVSNLSITSGSPVKASAPSLTTTVEPVLIITDGSPVKEVSIELSESDIAKVKPNQNAVIDVNAVSNKKYDAKVVRVDEIGTDKQGVMIYKAFIAITSPDEDLRSGMNADVEIITKKISNVLSVPNSAVKPYQGGRGVRVPDKNSKEGYKYVPVTVGIRGEDRTEIIKGLTEGQKVITSLSNEQLQRPGLFGN